MQSEIETVLVYTKYGDLMDYLNFFFQTKDEMIEGVKRYCKEWNYSYIENSFNYDKDNSVVYFAYNPIWSTIEVVTDYLDVKTIKKIK